MRACDCQNNPPLDGDARPHLNGTDRTGRTVRVDTLLEREQNEVMKSKKLMLGFVLTTGAFAQSSILGAIATFTPAGTGLDNQQYQLPIAVTQAVAEEAYARVERIRLETERIRLESLRESQRAQQSAREVKRSADLENQAKALETQLADARRQVRIEHLKVLAIKAREKHADFDKTVSRLNVPISQAMTEAILDSESGAEIMYWLGQHPTDCKLIGDLEPLSAVREIGRIEGTIAPLAP
jgi:hypothetical protein